MPMSAKLLNPGEVVLVDVRTHPKALLLPAVWLVLVAAVAGFACSFPSGEAAPVGIAVIWAVALLVVLVVVVKPFLVWWSTSWTVTDRRLVTRSGILVRRGHDIALARVSDLQYEHGLVDRVLGCGTLVVSDAGEQGPVRLTDIPHVERVHRQISHLLHSGADRLG